MDLYETENKLALFGEMVGCCHDLYLWHCDGTLRLLNTNCPNPGLLQELFTLGRQDSALREELAKKARPLLYTGAAGILWILFPELDNGELFRVRVLGPLLIDDLSPVDLEIALERAGAGENLRKSAPSLARAIPVISISRVQEYAVMVQYLISGERIQFFDLRYYQEGGQQRTAAAGTAPKGDAHGTYQAEREMVRMVREGDLSLLEQINRMAVTGAMGQLTSQDTLRTMKIAVFVCLTLFSRAAIEGGLSPESSLSLADRYFQSVDAAKNISELSSIAYTLQRDYVERVHAVRSSGVSREMEGACAYIANHLEEEITLQDLARSTGYAEYYFSKKFKQETGMSPADYIRSKRLERAASLLKTTDMGIQEIAAQLQFCSHSYFTDSFRRKYGVSPAKYRKE